jgi:hypothetical protein
MYPNSDCCLAKYGQMGTDSCHSVGGTLTTNFLLGSLNSVLSHFETFAKRQYGPVLPVLCCQEIGKPNRRIIGTLKGKF